MSIKSDYQNLLIKQYWDKPRARGEVGFKADLAAKAINALNSLSEKFDVDSAQGEQLDFIGRKVGQPRSIESAMPKLFFGFSDNTMARGMGDRHAVVQIDKAPMADKFEPTTTALELTDHDYRRFIKARIASNNSSGALVGQNSLQQAVLTAFDGKAYAVDNHNMTLTLYISNSVPDYMIRAIAKADLLPVPHGVG